MAEATTQAPAARSETQAGMDGNHGERHQDHGYGGHQHGHSHGAPEINVAHTERVASTVGGSLLALWGVGRRSTTGAVAALIGAALVHRGVTGHCNAYAAMGVDTAGGHHPGDEPSAEPKEYFAHGIHVEESVTIDKPADELFRFWRNLSNLPKFMDHLKEVKEFDQKKSHWVAKAPAGMSVHWDAEIINEEPNRVITWQSLEGATVDNAGSVRFTEAAGGKGTEVHVVLDYIPPAGQVGKLVAKLFGEEPGQQVREDLGRLKQAMESGK